MQSPKLLKTLPTTIRNTVDCSVEIFKKAWTSTHNNMPHGRSNHTSKQKSVTEIKTAI